MTSFSAAKTSGLSETALASASSTSAAPADLRQAGAHHLRLAAQGVQVLHLLQLWCDCEIALSSVGRWRYNAAASICRAGRALHGCAHQTDDVSPAPLRWLTPADDRGGEQILGFEQTAQGQKRSRLVPLSSASPLSPPG